VQLYQRETRKPTPCQWGIISALALFVIVLCTSLSAAQGYNPTTPKTVTAEVHRGIQRSVRIPAIDGDDIRFSRLSTAQGLSQTQVAQIVQDDRGFIWFGTQYGLDRYDGYEFRVFTHDPTRENSLSCVFIHSLFKDCSGTLWVGCDQFLDRFDSVHETFTHYRIDTGEVGNYVSEISQDRTGILWLATGSGLFGLNPDTGHIIHHLHDPSNASSLGSNQVRCTLEDRTGRFWVADGENLEEFDRESGRVLAIQNEKHQGKATSSEDDLTQTSGQGRMAVCSLYSPLRSLDDEMEHKSRNKDRRRPEQNDSQRFAPRRTGHGEKRKEYEGRKPNPRRKELVDCEVEWESFATFLN
jgi:hypothetical protein